jgi:hypothetical protein
VQAELHQSVVISRAASEQAYLQQLQGLEHPATPPAQVLLGPGTLQLAARAPRAAAAAAGGAPAPLVPPPGLPAAVAGGLGGRFAPGSTSSTSSSPALAGFGFGSAAAEGGAAGPRGAYRQAPVGSISQQLGPAAGGAAPRLSDDTGSVAAREQHGASDREVKHDRGKLPKQFQRRGPSAGRRRSDTGAAADK